MIHKFIDNNTLITYSKYNFRIANLAKMEKIELTTLDALDFVKLFIANFGNGSPKESFHMLEHVERECSKRKLKLLKQELFNVCSNFELTIDDVERDELWEIKDTPKNEDVRLKAQDICSAYSRLLRSLDLTENEQKENNTLEDVEGLLGSKSKFAKICTGYEKLHIKIYTKSEEYESYSRKLQSLKFELE